MAEVEWTGLDPLIANMQALPRRVQGGVLRKAVRAGSAPFLQEMRQLAPRDTGQLIKSLGTKIKTYRASGTVVGIIGPRRGFKAVGLRDRTGRRVIRNPSRTVHLVEEGTKARTVKRRNARNAKVAAMAFGSGAGRATHFIRRAIDARRAESIALMSAKLREGIEQAWTRELSEEGGDE